jgi:hypothetical protein
MFPKSLQNSEIHSVKRKVPANSIVGDRTFTSPTLIQVAITTDLPDTRIWEELGLNRSRVTGYSY